jgi:hypothetical protein
MTSIPVIGRAAFIGWAAAGRLTVEAGRLATTARAMASQGA